MTLRSEVCEATTEGVDALPWREGVWRWRDYIKDTRGMQAVFENGAGERATSSTSSRFDPEYADKQYAKLKDLERGIRDDYGRRLHTAMLTFTASSTDDEGDPRPPVDHLNELDASWEAVRRALSRVLEGRRWEYLGILEPHKSGYLHLHVAVFVDGKVRREDFAPVIEAHLRNCELAGEDAHRVDDDSTISVRHAGRDRDEGGLENIGTYLAEYLGTYGEDALDQEEHEQMANAVLWATGKQRWRPSQGAQSYMATETKEAALSDWELVGIEDEDGEFHEVEGAHGGVSTMETATDRRADRPPD